MANLKSVYLQAAAAAKQQQQQLLAGDQYSKGCKSS
jgi:hypothetical protein